MAHFYEKLKQCAHGGGKDAQLKTKITNDASCQCAGKCITVWVWARGQAKQRFSRPLLTALLLLLSLLLLLLFVTRHTGGVYNALSAPSVAKPRREGKTNGRKDFFVPSTRHGWIFPFPGTRYRAYSVLTPLVCDECINGASKWNTLRQYSIARKCTPKSDVAWRQPFRKRMKRCYTLSRAG